MPAPTQRTSHPFRLFDLPIEMRLLIYDHYFSSTNLVPGSYPLHLRHLVPGRTDATETFEPLLLSSDDRIREEALKPYLQALTTRHSNLKENLETIKENRSNGRREWNGQWLEIEVLEFRAKVIRMKIEDVRNEIDSGQGGVAWPVLRGVGRMWIFPETCDP